MNRAYPKLIACNEAAVTVKTVPGVGVFGDIEHNPIIETKTAIIAIIDKTHWSLFVTINWIYYFRCLGLRKRQNIHFAFLTILDLEIASSGQLN